MVKRLERYKKALAAALTLLAGLGAQFAPILGGVLAPEVIQGLASLGAVALVYYVPNERDGQSVDFLAGALTEIAAQNLRERGLDGVLK